MGRREELTGRLDVGGRVRAAERPRDRRRRQLRGALGRRERGDRGQRGRDHAARGAIEVDAELDVGIVRIVGREPRLGPLAELLLDVVGERGRRRAQAEITGELLEGLPHLVAALEPVGRLVRERLEDDRREPRRDVGPVLRGRGHVAEHDRRHREEVVVALEQAPHGAQLVEHDAEREHVAAAIDRLADALLGGHVRDLALERAGPGLDGAVRGLRDPEVRDLDAAVVADEEVGRRHVAVHDPERRPVGGALLVRVVEPGRGGGHDRQHVLERHLRVLLADAGQERAGVLAVHVLHREEVLAALLADVVDLDDVVVVQRGREPRLVQEHLDVALVARLLGADPLDHHVALEPLDAGRAREQHVGHAALREVLDHLVAAERAGRGGANEASGGAHAITVHFPHRQLK